MNSFEMLELDQQQFIKLLDRIEVATMPETLEKLFFQLKKDLEIHFNIEEAVLFPYLNRGGMYHEELNELFCQQQEIRKFFIYFNTEINQFDSKKSFIQLFNSIKEYVETENNLLSQLYKHLDHRDFMALDRKLKSRKEAYAPVITNTRPDITV